MSKTARLNLILLAIFVVIGGAVVITEKPFAKKDEKYFAPGLIFPDFTAELVWEVSIRRGEDEARVKRTNTGWIVTTLYDHPADFGKIQEVVARVANWKNSNPVAVTDQKHKDMAVSDTEGTACSLKDMHGNILAEFVVGRLGGFDPERLPPGGKINPEAMTFYLRPLPGNTVYLLREFLIGTFTFQSEHWADKRVFGFPEEAPVKLVAEWEGETLVFDKVGDEWQIEGMEVPLDTSLSQRAAGTITRLSGMNVVDPEKPLSEWGLDAPTRKVTITLSDGQEARLLIGKDKDDRICYGKNEASRYTMEFTKSLFDGVFKEKREFKKTAFYEFRGWDARTITLWRPDGQVRLVKGKDENDRDIWEIAEPEEKATDRQVVSTLISTFGRLRLDDYVEKVGEGTDLATYGLDSPTYKIWAEVGADTHTLLLGADMERKKEIEEGQEGETEILTYAMKEGGEWIVLLASDQVEKIRKTFDEVREKTPAEIEAAKKAAEEAKSEEEAPPAEKP